MQYESTFNAIDNILRQEAGCSNELDYIDQTSWLLFLITRFLHCSTWTLLKTASIELDLNNTRTCPDLVGFVNLKLFFERQVPRFGLIS